MTEHGRVRKPQTTPLIATLSKQLVMLSAKEKQTQLDAQQTIAHTIRAAPPKTTPTGMRTIRRKLATIGLFAEKPKVVKF